MIKYEQIVTDVLIELVEARKNFPTNEHMALVFQEEAGELTRELLECHHGRSEHQDVYTEAIQAIAMIVRLIQEGDPSLKFKPSKIVGINTRK